MTMVISTNSKWDASDLSIGIMSEKKLLRNYLLSFTFATMD